MTNLSDKPARWRMWLGVVVAPCLGCVSLEPLSSYSQGSGAVQEPAPAIDALPAAADVELPLAPAPEVDVSEGLPADGELALEPVLTPEEPPLVEPEVGPTCTGAGEFPNAQGTTCYLRSAENAGWIDALASCQAWGGGLAVVDSREEDEFLGRQLDVSFWLGASDRFQEGRVVWSGGAPLVFSNWAMGEPNNYQGGEDCVLKTMPVGSWNDQPCGEPNAYVCERSED
ncbi:MAG: C-type lectin domain-containing protein [Deltaproteobacteria bacterium]